MKNYKKSQRAGNQTTGLKNALKTFKLNEPTISTILGALVVLAIGFVIINSFKSKTTSNQITSTASQTAETQQVSLPKSHKVEKNENLWKIAEKYYKSGYNWTDIAKENKLKNANVIIVGEELALPQVQPKVVTIAENTQIVKSDSKFGPAIQGDNYTAIKGDHLWGIAVRAYGDGYRWVDIAKENKLKNPNIIHVGQTLTLPPKK